MSSYQGSTSLRADAKAVFDFVTDPENLCQLIPTARECDFGVADVVHLQGECPDGPYRGVASLHLDRENLWMRWNSKANLNYRGSIHVKEAADGSEISLHLEFDPGPEAHLNVEFEHLLKHHPATIQEAIDEFLRRVKSRVDVPARAGATLI